MPRPTDELRWGFYVCVMFLNKSQPFTFECCAFHCFPLRCLVPGFQLYLKIVRRWRRVWSVQDLPGAPTVGGQFHAVSASDAAQHFWAAKSWAASQEAGNWQSSGALQIATIFTGNIYDTGKKVAPCSSACIKTPWACPSPPGEWMQEGYSTAVPSKDPSTIISFQFNLKT